jgi:hypothetical protein
VKIRHSYFGLGKIRVLRLTARGAPVNRQCQSSTNENKHKDRKKFQLFPFVYQFQTTGQNNTSATYHFSSITSIRPRTSIKSHRRTKHGIQAKDNGPGKSITCQQSTYFMLSRVDRRLV